MSTIDDILNEYRNKESGYKPTYQEGVTFDNPEVAKIVQETRNVGSPSYLDNYNFGNSGQNLRSSGYREEVLKKSGVDAIFRDKESFSPKHTFETTSYQVPRETTSYQVPRDETNILRSYEDKYYIPPASQTVTYENYDYKPSTVSYDYKPTEVIYERSEQVKQGGIKSYEYADYKPTTVYTDYKPTSYEYNEYKPQVYETVRYEHENVKRGGVVTQTQVVENSSSGLSEQAKIRSLEDDIERKRTSNGDSLSRLSKLQSELSDLKSQLYSRENELNILKLGGNDNELKKLLEEKEREIERLRHSQGGKVENRGEIENLMTAIKNKDFENEQLRKKIEEMEIQNKKLKIDYGKNKESSSHKTNASAWCC